MSRAPWSRRRSWRADILAGCCAFAVIVAGGLWLNGARPMPRPWQHTNTIATAWEDVPGSAIRITDGDTFRIGYERVRILNVDAPEMPEHAHCPAEIALAYRARDFLHDRLAAAQRIEVNRQDLDRFGRTLAQVRVDGQDVGDQLIAAGLAQRWNGHHARWCSAQ